MVLHLVFHRRRHLLVVEDSNPSAEFKVRIYYLAPSFEAVRNDLEEHQRRFPVKGTYPHSSPPKFDEIMEIVSDAERKINTHILFVISKKNDGIVYWRTPHG